MTVYVDSAVNAYGRMKMSHMIADTTDELLEMAAKIGVPAKWIQHRGERREHFDVCQSKRAAAIAQGAQVVDNRGFVRVMDAKAKITPKS